VWPTLASVTAEACPPFSEPGFSFGGVAFHNLQEVLGLEVCDDDAAASPLTSVSLNFCWIRDLFEARGVSETCAGATAP
jgi:hypothetical protein